MNAKINEIFTSIQGEGKYVGLKQLFIRFQGCHLNCPWCDTPQAKSFKTRVSEYSARKLLKIIEKEIRLSHSVSLTGGEPLCQIDFLEEFLPVLRKKRMKVYLETNGVLYKELGRIIKNVDMIAMDFKLPSSTGLSAYWEHHAKFLKIALAKDVFIKAVITQKTELKDARTMAKLIAGINPNVTCVLQPNAFDPQHKIINQCLHFQEYCLKYLSDVRIVPQFHKIWNLR